MKTKKAISFILSLSMIFTMVTGFTTIGFEAVADEVYAEDANSGYCGDPNVNGGKDVTWSCTGTALTISGSGVIADYENNEKAPWYGKKYYTIEIKNGVTRIGKNAFSNNGRVHTVWVRESLTEIGDGAFQGCTAVDGIYWGDSKITTIGENAFKGCSKLEEIKLPSTIQTIGAHAFDGCVALTKIYIGGEESLGSVTSIGALAFRDCKFSKVIFPSTLTKIEEGAFYNCTNLKELVFEGSTAPSIDWGSDTFPVFGNVAGSGTVNVLFKARGGFLDRPFVVNGETLGTDKSKAWYIEDNKTLQDLGKDEWTKVENNVDTITLAYPECTSELVIKYVKDKMGIVTANTGEDFCFFFGFSDDNKGRYAVYQWENDHSSPIYRGKYSFDEIMETVEYLPFYVIGTTTIKKTSGTCGAIGDGSNANWSYDKTSSTITITGSEEMADYTDENPAPWNIWNNATNVVVSGVSNVGNNAFKGFQSLTSANLSVSDIGDDAFYGCNKLSSLTLTGVKNIGESAFCNAAFNNLTLTGVENIGEGAFGSCAYLRDITFKGVKTISNLAFHYCTKLNYVTFMDDTVPKIDGGAFYLNGGIYQTEGCTVFVTPGAFDAYASVLKINLEPVSKDKSEAFHIEKFPTVDFKTLNSEVQYETIASVVAVPNVETAIPSVLSGAIPTRENAQYRYSSAGLWSTEPFAETGVALGAKMTVREDTTYYAAYTKSGQGYNVTLDDNGATTPASVSLERPGSVMTACYGDAIPTVAILPQKEGKIFAGYYTSVGGILVTKYINADGTSAKNSDFTAATVLYAKWDEPSNGGSHGGAAAGGTDSAKTENISDAFGNKATVATGADGKLSVSVTVSENAAKEAVSAGKPIELPVPEVKAGEAKETAPVVAVALPKGTEKAAVSVKVTEATDTTVLMKKNADGTYTPVPTSTLSADGNTLMADISNGEYIVLDNKVEFTDVKEGIWFEAGADFASSRGLMQGIGNGVFGASGQLTAAQTAAVLGRLQGENMTDSWNKAVANNSNKVAISRQDTMKMLYDTYKTMSMSEPALSDAVTSFKDAGAIASANLEAMLMYGKEASNRKQEIDRQHYTIPNQRPKDKHCGKI